MESEEYDPEKDIVFKDSNLNVEFSRLDIAIFEEMLLNTIALNNQCAPDFLIKYHNFNYEYIGGAINKKEREKEEEKEREEFYARLRKGKSNGKKNSRINKKTLKESN